jgi:predicted DNA-binding transcriptional regulator AlpA
MRKKTPDNPDHIGMREVLKMTKLPRWSLMSRMFEYNEFPFPVAVKGRKELWSRTEVLAWMAILERYNQEGSHNTEQLCANWRRLRATCMASPMDGLPH